jgi:DNA-binding response OmpR family regulator
MVSVDLAGRRLLLVEDELMVAMALEDALVDAGLVIVGPVARVSRAVALAREQPVDVALLDINLAGERVFPVADVLAAKGVPFLFLTGYSKSSLPAEYNSRPVLSKPCDMQMLLSEIGRALAPAGTGPVEKH